MIIGVSSACFYPQETEKSILALARAGVRNIEIFFNSRSELSGRIFDEILKIKNDFKMNVLSCHPFASFADSFFLFSEYQRRRDDFLEDSKKFFEAEAKLGSDIHVFHGCLSNVPVDVESYAENYLKLCNTAKSFGITVCHENVARCHCKSPVFMKQLSDLCGDDFKMTLDVKRARRSDVDPFEFVDLLGQKIAHLHLSDFDEKSDCTLPHKNGFDFEKLFLKMKELDYKGNAVLEVYSNAFEKTERLKSGKDFLEKIQLDCERRQ